MAINLTHETPIPLAAVPKLGWVRGRGGKRLHVATVHRWCSHGIRGVKLEFVQRGGTRVTTEAALLRFFAQLTQLQEVEPADRATQSNIQAERVNRELDALLDGPGLEGRGEHE
jgi:hypothetical protein